MFGDEKVYQPTKMTESDLVEFGKYFNDLIPSKRSKKTIDEHYEDWCESVQLNKLRAVKFL